MLFAENQKGQALLPSEAEYVPKNELASVQALRSLAVPRTRMSTAGQFLEATLSNFLQQSPWCCAIRDCQAAELTSFECQKRNQPSQPQSNRKPSNSNYLSQSQSKSSSSNPMPIPTQKGSLDKPFQFQSKSSTDDSIQQTNHSKLKPAGPQDQAPRPGQAPHARLPPLVDSFFHVPVCLFCGDAPDPNHLRQPGRVQQGPREHGDRFRDGVQLRSVRDGQVGFSGFLSFWAFCSWITKDKARRCWVLGAMLLECFRFRNNLKHAPLKGKDLKDLDIEAKT
jgi:hypothetical protein